MDTDNEFCHKCGGTVQFDKYCGAYVCCRCGHHQGLCRCYCGWAADGGNGLQQLRELGENVDDDY